MLALQRDTSGAQQWIDEGAKYVSGFGRHPRDCPRAGAYWLDSFFQERGRGSVRGICRVSASATSRRRSAPGDSAMVGLAQVLVALGRTDEAKPMAREIIEFAEAHNDKRSEHFDWHYLADCELILGNCAESLELYKKSLMLAQAIGDKVEISFEVQGVAMSLAGLGVAGFDEEKRTALGPFSDPLVDPSAVFEDKVKVAVQLAGAVKAEWNRMGMDIHVRFWDDLLDRYIGFAKQKLGAESFAAEWVRGRELPFDEAVNLALEIEAG